MKTEVEDASTVAETKVDIKLLAASYSANEVPQLCNDSEYRNSTDGSDEEFFPQILKPEESFSGKSTTTNQRESDRKHQTESDRKHQSDIKEMSRSLEAMEEKRERSRLQKIKQRSNKSQSPKSSKFKPCPDVWLKDPSPERLRDGVRTDEFYMAEETAAAGPPYKCLLCEYKTQLKKNLKKHFIRIHSKEKLYRCKVCGVARSYKEDVQQHWHFMHNPNRGDNLTLEEIEEKRERSRLQKRKERSNKFRDPKLSKFKPCPDVWLKDPSPERFRDGVRTDEFYMAEETALAGPPYKCLLCEYKTPSNRYLKKHFLNVHSKEKLYKCKVCGVARGCKENIVQHWHTAHNPNREDDLIHVCDTCGKKYKTETQLKYHQILHEGLQLSCKYCAKSFKSPSSLRAHEQRHGIEIVRCRICGKLLTGAKKAEEHEFFVHFDTTTEDCKLCGKTVKPSSIKNHMERMHGDREKTYNCHICINSFALRSSLQKHIAIVHEKSQQFKCPFCEVVLSYRGKFKRHSNRRHGGVAIPQAVKDLLRPAYCLTKVNEPASNNQTLSGQETDS